MQRIGVLTGGGDCAGLNAVIRAVVKTAILNGEIVALQNDQIVSVPVEQAIAVQKSVPLQGDIVKTALGLDIRLGDILCT
jgi:6-phosphofructokinase